MVFNIDSVSDEDLEQYRVRPNIDVYWLPDRICLQYYRDLKRWVGLAALSANPRKAVVDQEVWEEKIGRKFDKDIQWYGATKLMDHLSRESLLVVVYIHSNLRNVIFRIVPDVPPKLAGKLGAFERLIEKHDMERLMVQLLKPTPCLKRHSLIYSATSMTGATHILSL